MMTNIIQMSSFNSIIPTVHKIVLYTLIILQLVLKIF